MTGVDDPASLAVVHLVVRELGIDYFREFIGSYRAFDAGVDHVLILALKQFGGEADFSPYQKELAGIEYEILHVPDLGHDIGSYVAIASETEFQRYCFINSKTTLNTDKWLEKLIAEHDKNPDGMVGSTGSWQSLASDALKYRLDTRPVLLLNIRRVLGYLWRLRKFPGFPNPHLRTNVFVVSRETFRSLDFGKIGSKNDTWKLESGRNGISRQIERRGGRAVCVSHRPPGHYGGGFRRDLSGTKSIKQRSWAAMTMPLLSHGKRSRFCGILEGREEDCSFYPPHGR